VLRAVVEDDGGDFDRVRRVTIGFSAVPSLIAGRVDAVVSFWNAEGVALRERGVRTREFRVDEFGAPRYPELLLVTRSGSGEDGPAKGVVTALARGYELLGEDPDGALENLLAEVPGLDRSSQKAQLDALTSSEAFVLGDSTATSELDEESVARWDRWARQNGLVGR
jgi:ABC-type nitrate/sulfonate/bicarbonate transport system substrate-binding protein